MGVGARPPLPNNSNPAVTLAALPARRNHASICSYTRGPLHLHVNPPNPPKRRPPHLQPPVFSVFVEVVCTVGTTPPHIAASPPPNGGNCITRGVTRRRHADSQPLMLQNPHCCWSEGCRRDRRAWLRCPWAAGPRRALRRRTDRSSRRGRPKRAAPTPPPAKFRMQFPHGTNQHKLKNRRISTIRTHSPICAHGNCMRNCGTPGNTSAEGPGGHRWNRRGPVGTGGLRDTGPACGADRWRDADNWTHGQRHGDTTLPHQEPRRASSDIKLA